MTAFWFFDISSYGIIQVKTYMQISEVILIHTHEDLYGSNVFMVILEFLGNYIVCFTLNLLTTSLSYQGYHFIYYFCPHDWGLVCVKVANIWYTCSDITIILYCYVLSEAFGDIIVLFRYKRLYVQIYLLFRMMAVFS